MQVEQLTQEVHIQSYTNGAWEDSFTVNGFHAEKKIRCYLTEFKDFVPALSLITVAKDSRITKNHAVKLNGIHYMICAMEDPDGSGTFLQLACAQVKPKTCQYESMTRNLGELNRPMDGEKEQLTFEGILLEKENKFQSEGIYTVCDQEAILIVPNTVELNTGGAVRVQNTRWVILAAYPTDGYITKYGMRNRRDL